MGIFKMSGKKPRSKKRNIFRAIKDKNDPNYFCTITDKLSTGNSNLKAMAEILAKNCMLSILSNAKNHHILLVPPKAYLKKIEKESRSMQNEILKYYIIRYKGNNPPTSSIKQFRTYSKGRTHDANDLGLLKLKPTIANNGLIYELSKHLTLKTVKEKKGG